MLRSVAVPSWDLRSSDGRSPPASPRASSACRYRDPGLPLAKLPLADQTELAQVRDWGTHSTSYPRDRTVAEIFEDVARERKGRIAVAAGEVGSHMESLDSRANAVAECCAKRA